MVEGKEVPWRGHVKGCGVFAPLNRFPHEHQAVGPYAISYFREMLTNALWHCLSN